MVIRFAKEDELERINVLRKQVNDLHVEGKPDVFKPGFSEELQNYVYYIFKDPEQKIVVADKDGELCGFAILHHIYKPENPFMNHHQKCGESPQHFIDISDRRIG